MREQVVSEHAERSPGPIPGGLSRRGLLSAEILLEMMFRLGARVDFNDAATRIELLTGVEGSRVIDALIGEGLVEVEQERGLLRRVRR